MAGLPGSQGAARAAARAASAARAARAARAISRALAGLIYWQQLQKAGDTAAAPRHGRLMGNHSWPSCSMLPKVGRPLSPHPAASSRLLQGPRPFIEAGRSEEVIMANPSGVIDDLSRCYILLLSVAVRGCRSSRLRP
jgi:hypothetical protein